MAKTGIPVWHASVLTERLRDEGGMQRCECESVQPTEQRSLSFHILDGPVGKYVPLQHSQCMLLSAGVWLGANA